MTIWVVTPLLMALLKLAGVALAATIGGLFGFGSAEDATVRQAEQDRAEDQAAMPWIIWKSA